MAAEVRLKSGLQTISIDGLPWKIDFKAVWQPLFVPGEHDVIAPCLTPRGWGLFLNGDPLWNKYFAQLWHQTFSSDGERIAAVVAPSFGRWTIAVNGYPWQSTFGDAVLPPVFSEADGKIAAVVKDNNRWTIAVEGVPWEQDFDMIWDPVFSPNGKQVAARAIKGNEYFLILNGKISSLGYTQMWDPIFSPDGEKILVKAVQFGRFYRNIFSVREILR